MGCSQSAEAIPATDATVSKDFTKIEGGASQPPGAARNSSEESAPTLARAQTRRRVAVAAENSDVLASMRWKSSFEAVRKEQPKTPEHLAKIKAVIATNPIFGQLSQEVLDTLAAKMRTEFVAQDKTIIEQDDTGDCLYVVLEGEFSVFIDGEKKDKVYGPGDCFGELALLYEAKRAATIKCTSTNGGLVDKLGRVAFRNHVSGHMAKAKAGLEERLARVPVLAGLSPAQVHQLSEAMEQVSFKDGEYIERIGAPADSLYVILSGEVTCKTADGAELRLLESQFFGESCLQKEEGEKKRQADVIAVGNMGANVRCARLKAADVATILGDIQSVLSMNFMKKVMFSVELFRDIEPSEVAQILKEMKSRHVAVGEAIVTEGKANDTFYLIKTGLCEVQLPGGGEKIQLRGGQYFGERSILTSEPAVATVVALEASELMCLDKAGFNKHLSSQDVLDRELKRREKERASLTTTKLAWDDLDLRQVLGEGSFGCVRLCVHKPTKEPYALKALHKGHLISTNQVQNTINEKRMMEACIHPFILKCIGAFNGAKHVHLVLDLCLGGELFTRMSKVGVLKAKDAAIYTAMVASALGFLSARNIAHRDLKLENLMFDAKGYLKVIDFGFAKIIEKRTWTFCGTPDYLAPEILSHAGHNHAVDWWTLGILLYEMVHGEPPFVDDDQMVTFKRISKLDYRVRSTIPPECKDLIQKILVLNPSKRYGMLAEAENDVLRHPLLAHIDVQKLIKKELPVPFVPKCKDPTDCSNFDHYPAMSSGKKYDKYLDKKYDETWAKEFG